MKQNRDEAGGLPVGGGTGKGAAGGLHRELVWDIGDPEWLYGIRDAIARGVNHEVIQGCKQIIGEETAKPNGGAQLWFYLVGKRSASYQVEFWLPIDEDAKLSATRRASVEELVADLIGRDCGRKHALAVLRLAEELERGGKALRAHVAAVQGG